MIEVIEYADGPIKFPANKDISIRPGNIVSLTRTSNNLFCTLSGPTNAFGIVTGPIDDLGFIPVLSGPAIVITDLFEETLEYNPGALIYSNQDGLITTRKIDDNSLLLAYVIAGNTSSRNYIEIHWI